MVHGQHAMRICRVEFGDRRVGLRGMGARFVCCVRGQAEMATSLARKDQTIAEKENAAAAAEVCTLGLRRVCVCVCGISWDRVRAGVCCVLALSRWIGGGIELRGCSRAWSRAVEGVPKCRAGRGL